MSPLIVNGESFFAYGYPRIIVNVPQLRRPSLSPKIVYVKIETTERGSSVKKNVTREFWFGFYELVSVCVRGVTTVRGTSLIPRDVSKESDPNRSRRGKLSATSYVFLISNVLFDTTLKRWNHHGVHDFDPGGS